jgi:hypothetical protein
MAATAADEGDDSGSFVADQTEFNIFNTDRKLTALRRRAQAQHLPEKKALIIFRAAKRPASKTSRSSRPQ